MSTPEALGCLFKLIHNINGNVGQSGVGLEEIQKGFQAICDSFGFKVIIEKNIEQMAPPMIQELAVKRWEAKLAKDWQLADQLRSEILAEGWEVKDSKEGYELNRLSNIF